MRLLGFLALALCCAVPASASEKKVSDGNGKTIAVILDCNSCKDEGKGKNCISGVTDGFNDGKRCGACLLESNYGARLLYSSDIQILGTLKKPDGSAMAEDFVRLYLPNTWTVRTRSSKDGLFRLLLGATQERQGERILVRLGDRVRTPQPDAGEQPDYALYMLPEDYKPCNDAK